MKKVIIAAIAAIMLSACSTQTHVGGYQDHLRTHHRDNFQNRDNGGCGWHNN